MTQEPQSTHESSGIEWPASRYQTPCMSHGIHPALDPLISSFGVRCLTKSWNAHDHDQRFRENQRTEIGNSQRLCKEANVTINKVSAMRLGVVKIIQTVGNSKTVHSTETDHIKAANACCINNADTVSSKQVHWLTNSLTTNHSTTYHGCNDRVQFDSSVAWGRLPIARIHLQVAPEDKTHYFLAHHHNVGWMDSG